MSLGYFFLFICFFVFVKPYTSILQDKRDFEQALRASLGNIVDKIKKENNIANPRNLSFGTKLKFSLLSKRPMTLEEFAGKNGVPIEKLAALNPAVIKKDQALPPGVMIRLPRV